MNTPTEKCSHPDCGFFRDGAGTGCRAMRDNACAAERATTASAAPTITRWAFANGNTRRHPEGAWVEYADHLAALDARAEEARREALEAAANVAGKCYIKDPFRFELGTEAAAAIRALGVQPVAEAAAQAPWEARRYCKGDAQWTDWQAITKERYDELQGDDSFEFRKAAAQAICQCGQGQACQVCDPIVVVQPTPPDEAEEKRLFITVHWNRNITQHIDSREFHDLGQGSKVYVVVERALAAKQAGNTNT